MNIKPLRKRLEAVAKLTGKRLNIVQQDYLLSWLLKGIFQHPILKTSLIFKGGTALKKCYFGDYRFSEDLDFSATKDLPDNQIVFKSITEACALAESQMREYSDIQLFAEEYQEREPHPHGQIAFKIQAQFPWEREPLTNAMIEITRDEIVLLEPSSKAIHHIYDEPIEQQVIVYLIEEIILEKLRAILQYTKKLHERDWTRSRARDYYDLWRIFSTFQDQLVINGLPLLLQQKCEHRQVSFQDADAFFDEKTLLHVEKTWHQWLVPLVSELPEYKLVIAELRPKIESLLNPMKSIEKTEESLIDLIMQKHMREANQSL